MIPPKLSRGRKLPGALNSEKSIMFGVGLFRFPIIIEGWDCVPENPDLWDTLATLHTWAHLSCLG